MKSLIKLFNRNFDKGITVYQAFLMVFMFVGAVTDNKTLLLFSMIHCLIGYLEPNQDRFSLGRKK